MIGIFRTELVTIGEPEPTITASEPLPGIYMLPQANGTAKRLQGNGNSATLATMQVAVRKFVNDATPPTAPTNDEWNNPSNPNYIQPLTGPSVTFDPVSKQYNWVTGPYSVRVEDNGKNKRWARAKWVIPPAPPTYQYGYDPEIEVMEFVAETPAHAFNNKRAAPLPTVVTSEPAVDIHPACRDGEWLLYKDIPANLIARLMLNEYIPLKASTLCIAAEAVDWELALIDSIRLLGMRRASGSDLAVEPAGSLFQFPFRRVQKWAVVLHQQSDIPWLPNPFVVVSHDRCQADTAVVYPGADLFVRINFPDDIVRMMQGTYSLWVNPHLNIPDCCGATCPPAACGT